MFGSVIHPPSSGSRNINKAQNAAWVTLGYKWTVVLVLVLFIVAFSGLSDTPDHGATAMHQVNDYIEISDQLKGLADDNSDGSLNITASLTSLQSSDSKPVNSKPADNNPVESKPVVDPQKQRLGKVPNIMLSHITQTAGTTIETVARAKDIMWGKFTTNKKTAWTNFGKDSRCRCLMWHVPVKHLMKAKGSLSYEERVGPMRAKLPIFVVVRDPRTRIFSQLNMWVRLSTTPREERNKKWVDVLRRRMREFLNTTKNDGCYNDCHWMPQNEYVFDDEGKQYVKHIIKFENFEAEINALMRQYGHNDIVFNQKKSSHDDLGEWKKLPIDIREMVRRVYHEDFIRFYPEGL